MSTDNTTDKLAGAFPIEGEQFGLTAIEYACIELRIPESGNEWLDKLIAKAERRDLAAKAMQGAIASSVNDGEYSATRGATWSVEVATALQSELKKDA